MHVKVCIYSPQIDFLPGLPPPKSENSSWHETGRNLLATRVTERCPRARAGRLLPDPAYCRAALSYGCSEAWQLVCEMTILQEVVWVGKQPYGSEVCSHVCVEVVGCGRRRCMYVRPRSDVELPVLLELLLK